MGYRPDPKHERDAIRRWILRTDVEDLADHVIAGVDLDHPPPELFCVLPRGGTSAIDPPGLMAARRLKELEETVTGVQG